MFLCDYEINHHHHHHAPLPDVSGGGYRFTSAISDLVGDLARNMRGLLSGFSDNYIFLAGVHMPFVSVLNSSLGAFHSVLDTD